MIRSCFFGLLMAMLCLLSSAQAAPQLVRDINTAARGCWCDKPVTVNGVLYFPESDGVHGYELWRSDGTDEGTWLVKDIRPGSESSVIRNLVDAGDRFYFTVDGEGSNWELWTSDGTAAGTRFVQTIDSGPSGKNRALPMAVTNGILFFAGYDAATGYGLWRSDGSAAGTRKLSALNPNGMQRAGGAVYFFAANVDHGTELWKSDGSEAGTIMVKVIGGDNDRYRSLYSSAEANGALFFIARDADGNMRLWRSDSTEAGTLVQERPDSGSGTRAVSPYALVNVGGALYVIEQNTDGFSLLKTNGAPGGIAVVKDRFASHVAFYEFADAGGVLYMVSPTMDPSDKWRLWKSDGTEAGTQMVATLQPSNADGASRHSVFHLTGAGNNAFFRFDWWGEHGSGSELWKSDGTVSGTSLVTISKARGAETFRHLTNLNGVLAFKTWDVVNGAQFHKSDGTPAGTVPIKRINPSTEGSVPSGFTEVNGEVFFAATDGVNGRQLWKTDGTRDGTRLVKEKGPHPEGAFVRVNDTLFFAAQDEEHGVELWRSDGSAAGTALVKDINPMWNGAAPQSLTSANGLLFFTAGYGSDYGLWRSDGTSEGTIRLTAGRQYDSIQYLTEVNGMLYFAADDGLAGKELWKSDGSLAGTVMVKDINPGAVGSAPSDLVRFAEALYFSADDGRNGRELWRSDGSAAGTVLVKDLDPLFSGNPMALIDVNGKLFFTARSIKGSGWPNYNLWKSDGTAGGTMKIDKLSWNFFQDSTRNLTNVNGTLFFYYGVNFPAIGKSDGTEEGTMFLRNGPADNFLAVNGALFFSANGQAFRSDGTIAGTIPLGDFCNDCGELFMASNGWLYAARDDGVLGNELWKLRPPTPVTVRLENLAATFDGTPKEATCSASQPGVTKRVIYNGSATPPTAIGRYRVECAVVDVDYVGSDARTLSIDPPGQSIVFPFPGTVAVGKSAPLSATASSGLPVEYRSLSPDVCTVDGAIVTALRVGTCTVAANQPGSASFAAAAQVSQSFSVVAPSISRPVAPSLLRIEPLRGGLRVVFSAPSNNGGDESAIYTATCVGGGSSFSVSGRNSPLSLLGLRNGVSYSCSLVASNSAGISASSTAASMIPKTTGIAPMLQLLLD